MSAELHLSLLGKLQISRGGTPVSGFVSAKAQALLCYLAVSGRPHDRQLLAALLWGDMPDTEARTNLRTVLANLRKLVGDHLEISREAARFNQNSPYWLDVELFRTNLAAAGVSLEQPTQNLESLSGIEATEVALQPLRQAVELYQGDFLEGFSVRDVPEFEAWMLAQRERLRRQAIQGLLRLGQAYTIRGEYAAGLDYTNRLLTLEPRLEEGHHHMMILLDKTGQRSAALAQYEKCRRILAETLSVEPSPETQALYKRLQMNETSRPHNLPPQTTPFVGRETELSRIAAYLEDPACRLLTLVGLGGVGKTRLALQSAAKSLALFQDGVFFVPLAAVASSAEIIFAIANAIDFSMSGPAQPKAQLHNFLRGKEMLLLLDNFEQLLSVPLEAIDTGAATLGGATDGVDLVTDILQAAPRLKLFIISRDRLNLREEWVLEVNGLEFPEKAWAPVLNSAQTYASGDWKADTGAKRQTYDAITFFVQQAQRLQTGFTLTEEIWADVVRLCQLVNGMPLGLELAATWLPMFSCREIVAEIEQDLDFLSTSTRNIPDRHRSMRAVFESSWNLLSEPERVVLKRLSVFQSGFQREAAVRVAGASLSLLLGLLNKSLLRRDDAGRYGMHEIVWQFASEKLAQNPLEKAQVEAQHGAYYADFFQQRDSLLYSAHQSDILRDMRVEFDNIHKAWRWVIAHQQVQTVGQFVRGLWFFHSMQGRYHEGRERFQRAIDWLEKDGLASDEQTLVYAQILARQADMYYSLTRLTQAEELSRRSLSLLKPFDAPREVAFLLQTSGLIAWNRGEYLRARQYFEDSVEPARAGDDLWAAATSTSMLGVIAYALGEYTQAEQLLRQSLPTLRSIDKMWGLGITVIFLSRTVLALGRLLEAQQLAEEGLAVSRVAGDHWSTASYLSQAGAILNMLGDAERLEAKRLLAESVMLFRKLGEIWGLAYTLNRLGQTCCALGEYAEAGRYLQESLRIASESQVAPVTLDTLGSLAELWLQMAQNRLEPDKAIKILELLAHILNHPASEQVTRDRAARLLAKMAADLPQAAIKDALERSQTRRLEAVTVEILEQPWPL